METYTITLTRDEVNDLLRLAHAEAQSSGDPARVRFYSRLVTLVSESVDRNEKIDA